MVVVSCLRQKGSGPSELNERVFLLPKQNVMDAISDMYGKARVVSPVWDGEVSAGRWGDGLSLAVITGSGSSVVVGKRRSGRTCSTPQVSSPFK